MCIVVPSVLDARPHLEETMGAPDGVGHTGERSTQAWPFLYLDVHRYMSVKLLIFWMFRRPLKGLSRQP